MTSYPQPPGQTYYQTAVPNRRPGGLTALAIIAIVIASLSLICNGFGAIIALAGSVVNQPNQPKPSALMTGSAVGIAVVSFLIAIVWLVIGVMLLRMSATARKAGVGFAILHIVFILAAAVFQLVVLSAETKHNVEASMTAQNTDPQLANFSKGFAAGAAYGGPLIGAILAIVLPAIMLTGLTRSGIIAACGGVVSPGPGYQPQYSPGQQGVTQAFPPQYPPQQ